MRTLSRRGLLVSGAAALPLGAKSLSRTSSLEARVDATLRAGREKRQLPCVAAAFADAREVLYRGAFGTRDPQSGLAIKPDSIFAIASMTKAITSLAALQMVDQKKVTLDEPMEKYLPEFRGRQVLDGFDSQGRAKLRAPARPVTLRHLLTHTSGLCYSIWDPLADQWSKSPGVTPTSVAPLMFDPGYRWQYGQGIDAAGRLVESLSGMNLEAYFQKHILGPLEMKDTSYILPAEKFERLVTRYVRQPDGSLKPDERKPPQAPTSFNGGGGLYSTAPDYIRFMQAILKGGAGLLSRPAFRLLTTNQIRNIRAGYMKSQAPALTSDVDIHPGETDHHTLGFVYSPKARRGGRSAGSLAWAGMYNTYYWIDPRRKRCGVILMQLLPFSDREAIGLLGEFERAVYA